MALNSETITNTATEIKNDIATLTADAAPNPPDLQDVWEVIITRITEMLTDDMAVTVDSGIPTDGSQTTSTGTTTIT